MSSENQVIQTHEFTDEETGAQSTEPTGFTGFSLLHLFYLRVLKGYEVACATRDGAPLA